MPTVRAIETPADWAAAKAIRFAVFVDEQRVPAEEELDAHDARARHWLLLADDGQPVGTARAVTLDDGSWKIGRVAIAAAWRQQGLGLQLMKGVLAAGQAAHVNAFMLESQTHAIGFYERLGFVAEGPEFLDAGIPHRRMARRTQTGA